MPDRMPHRVAVERTPVPAYPAEPPFHPSTAYPEYPFGATLASEPNHVYAAVRDLLRRLELDSSSFGTPAWNPLGAFLRPGQTVFIKPNWVLSRHARGGNLWSIITHPSVLRAVADYCWIALRGRGRIVIGDAPQYDCNFEELAAASGLAHLQAWYRSRGEPRFDLLDLRKYWSPGKHFASLLRALPGDPAGNLTVNLDGTSALTDLPNKDLLYGAVYDRDETIRHHTGGRHDYEVSRSIMDADLVISIPKLKVHKKVGVTLNIKGLVGINTNKNLIVHYRVRPPSRGGDQFPDGLLSPTERLLIGLERWMYDHLLAPRIKPLEYLHRSIYWLHNHSTKHLGLKVDERKRLLDAGNWHGNDSAWRMAVDLLRLFSFADSTGVLRTQPQRRVLSIVDGIVGGESNGPLTPDAKPAGVLLAGENLLAVDLVATRLMGFDPSRVKTLTAALADPQLAFGITDPASDILVLADDTAWEACLRDPASRFLAFRPHPGWTGHLESGHPLTSSPETGAHD